MRLDDYLHERRETNADFARRTKLSEALVGQIRRGAGTRVSTAQTIVEASKAEPTQSGEWVDYPDLIPVGKSLLPQPEGAESDEQQSA